MSEIPTNLSVYFTSPHYDARSVPKPLLKAHTLKPGVFGRIVVTRGRIGFWVDGDPPSVEHVIPGDNAIRVLPGETHWVSLGDGAEFYLELLRED